MNFGTCSTRLRNQQNNEEVMILEESVALGRKEEKSSKIR